MLIAMLLAAAAPDQQVPERVEAALPPVAVATRGLIADHPRLDIGVAGLFGDQPLLEVQLAALFDEDRATPLAEEESWRIDAAVARLIQGVEEEQREQPGAAPGGPSASAPAVCGSGAPD